MQIPKWKLNSRDSNEIFFTWSTALHDAAYIIYHLFRQVTACSFNSRFSVEKRHYILKHFFYVISFFFFLLGHVSDLRSSHRILSHSHPPSNLLLDSLFLFQMSESALPHRHVFISRRQRRRDSSTYISPDSRESTSRFSRPVTEMHRAAQTPNNRIVCYTMIPSAARILARKSLLSFIQKYRTNRASWLPNEKKMFPFVMQSWIVF